MIALNLSSRSRKAKRGFTLVELAIVLAVAALLFAGLWRLMSGGSQQMRDQAAADQTKQLSASAQGFLASTNGQAFRAAQGAGANYALTIPGNLPGTAACRTELGSGTPAATDMSGFCDFLPVGFTSATRNSYNQGYAIRILNTADANNYSFMIMTSGGDSIPDTSGGRISGMIGNDGGFIYSQNVCGAPTSSMACGAYGAWSISAATYGLGACSAGGVANGCIAARTSSVSGTDSNVWLARKPYQLTALTAPGGTPEYHTMQTNMYFKSPAAVGGNDLFLNGNTIYGSATAAGNPAGSITNVQNIRVGYTGFVATDPGLSSVNMLIAQAPCSYTSPFSDGSCGYTAIQANGDIIVTGKMTANYFIYNATSDERLKHDIKPLENSLEKLGRIRALSFLMNDGNQKKMGVIAQEVEKVYPELVLETNDGYKGVDYMGFIGPLIGAIHELKDENDALKKQLMEQADSIKKLQQR